MAGRVPDVLMFSAPAQVGQSDDAVERFRVLAVLEAEKRMSPDKTYRLRFDVFDATEDAPEVCVNLSIEEGRPIEA